MSDTNETVKKSFMSNKVYDTLKVIAAILPIVGAFYYGLSEIWGLPYGGPIQATFALIASTLSGILLKLSHDYNKLNKALVENQAIETVPVEEPTEDEIPDEPEPVITEDEPADSPAIVTLLTSPPNAEILLCTHSKAFI